MKNQPATSFRGKRGMRMRLSEQCKMCKNNWDGHCVMGNDRWKARMADTEIECEEYEESDYCGYNV